MYSFNQRLEPKTIAGLPMLTAYGGFVFVGLTVCAIAFKSLLALLIFFPFQAFGVFIAIKGWRQRGTEHLQPVLRRAENDLRAVDLGIGHE